MTRSARIRYFPGPQIWALAQDAYLRGESAASIAARLNLTVNGLRKRAARKGWTRTQHAEAIRRSEHPAQTLSVLIARIGRMVHEGRLDEIGPLVQTAEGLARAVRAAPPTPPLTPSPEVMKAWRESETRRLEAYWDRRAREMAKALLTDRGHDLGDRWAASALRWRARMLGPEQAALDFARGVEGGWASRYWNEDGDLWPPQPPPAPSDRMQLQHLRGCEWRRETGRDWEGEA